MKTYHLSHTGIEATRIAYGTMMIGGDWTPSPITDAVRHSAADSLHAALDAGINFFDLADIYCRGKSDEAFSQIWKFSPSMRDGIVVQTKAGIRFAGDPNRDDPVRYDFSYDHLVRSVEGSLKRIGTDYIDILLLHRPDALVEGEEVARAFDHLQSSGKVRYFGVSNHSTDQLEYLRRFWKQPLVANQLELNILHSELISVGVSINQSFPAAPVHGQGTVEYCRLHDIRLQSWAPLAKGVLSGAKSKREDARITKTAEIVARYAEERNVSPEAIVVAWLLRHPAGIQPVIGTTNPDRIRACAEADNVELSREEWYTLLGAGRGAGMA